MSPQAGWAGSPGAASILIDMSRGALTETQQQIQDLARGFAADEIAPHATQWDRDACFPVAVGHRMGELGFLGMLIPE